MQAEKSVDTPGDRENFISQGFGGDNGKFPFHGVQEAAGSNPVTRTTEHLLEEAGALFFCRPAPNQRPPAPKARFNPPLPGGQAQPALPLVRIQSLGPNNDNPNYMIQVGNVFGFIISIENVL